MKTRVPGHPDTAVNVDAIARRRIIAVGGLDTRRGGGGDEVVLPRARSGMDCPRARQLDERADFGDAVFHRLEGADRLAAGAPGQCIVAFGFEQLFRPSDNGSGVCWARVCTSETYRWDGGLIYKNKH